MFRRVSVFIILANPLINEAEKSSVDPIVMTAASAVGQLNTVTSSGHLKTHSWFPDFIH